MGLNENKVITRYLTMLVEFLCVRRLIIFQVLEMQKMQHRIRSNQGNLKLGREISQRAMCTDDIFYFNLPFMFFSDFISLQDL